MPVTTTMTLSLPPSPQITTSMPSTTVANEANINFSNHANNINENANIDTDSNTAITASTTITIKSGNWGHRLLCLKHRYSGNPKISWQSKEAVVV